MGTDDGGSHDPKGRAWLRSTIAARLVVQLTRGLLINAPGIRSGATASDAAVLLFGILLIVQAQRPPRVR